MSGPARTFSGERFYIPFAFFLLYAVAVFFRPVLPIDETRYLSVAWEMFLRQDWLAPLTVNFEPYHHKPPLLFWMINGAWSVFGVSRWAATIPVVMAAAACIFLTTVLCRKLVPEAANRAAIVMIGSLPFLIYSTLILFDLSLTVFVLCSLICLLAFAQKRKFLYVFLMGLFLGLGVLTKGPVAYLHVIFPVLSGPLWIETNRNWKSWYAGFAGAVLVSFIPVLMWLIPVLKVSSDEFAFWLVWEQTMGRISGSYGDSHARPFYFYVPLLPVFFVPWVFFPAFWKTLLKLKDSLRQDRVMVFLSCWFVPTFIAFSMIGGKQPHYLVPLLPAGVIFTAYALKDLNARTLRAVAVFMVAAFICVQVAASVTVLKSYDLTPVAGYVAAHQDKDWAFVRKYHGEITFLARLDKKIDSLERSDLQEWFKDHPDGLAVIRYRRPEEVEAYETVLSMPYRKKMMGIFRQK